MTLVHVVIGGDSWTFGWTAVAGIATALLAAFTAWLAYSTRALARETDQDVRASRRPILAPQGVIELSIQALGERYEVRIVLSLYNTGRGPALNCEVSGRKPRSEVAIRWASSRVSTIETGGYDVIELQGVADLPDGPAWGVEQRHSFVATYEDVARNRYQSTFVLGHASPAKGGDHGPGVVGELMAQDIEVADLGEKAERRGWPR